MIPITGKPLIDMGNGLRNLRDSLGRINPSLADQVAFGYEKTVKAGPPDTVERVEPVEELKLRSLTIQYFPFLKEATISVPENSPLIPSLQKVSTEQRAVGQGNVIIERNYSLDIGSPEELDRLVKAVVPSRESTNYSLVDKLIAAGIPEEAIAENKELQDFIRNAESNEVVSANDTFYITDNQGEQWLLKVTDNEKKARIEASANYHLSAHFDFIVPGMTPEPIKANGLYLTLQKDVSESNVVRPLNYWIGSLALFHRDAEEILRKKNIVIGNKKLKSVDELMEMYDHGKGVHDLARLDHAQLEDAISHLQTGEDYIHGDLKRGNIRSSYLVDLEGCGRGNPGIDLSMLLMQYGVPKEAWGTHLETYLRIKGTDDFDSELRDLQASVEQAAIYTATKEIVGSSLREVKPNTAKNNQLLASYLD